jgi:methyltransferase (TIGR00027 family)
VAVRSRLAEDVLEEVVAAGIRQYVVLGAGLDTFAYRNPHADLHVFEVDHPATQTWKRQRLADVHIAVPENVTFVPADFSRDELPQVLQAAGLRLHEPSFFSWLGVTPYLEPECALSTLKVLAPLAGNGGGIVFDYIVSPQLLGPRQRAGFEVLSARAAAAGEPFRGDFEPSALVAAVCDMGFRSVRDIGPDELNETFFSNRADGLQVGSAGRMLAAFG